jgi:kumamolisin
MLKLKPKYHHARFRHNVSGVNYTPKQLAAFYGMPTNATVGAGKKVGVVELGGGIYQAALTSYFTGLGYPNVLPVIFKGINGATNQPGDANGDYVECMLDFCVIGGMAPGCQMYCYMADNTDAGVIAAFKQAIADGMDVITFSWGGPEDQWAAATITALNTLFQQAAAKGITITVAAGDSGSSDGETGNHVDFPASSPEVAACGGTSLPSLSPSAEVVWNDGSQGGATGGGVSTLFALPSWQAKAGVPGGKFRGLPDIAGDADPNTGWNIVIDTTSGPTVVGGTSADAPMWGAIAAYISQATGKNVGFLPAVLYSLPAGCFHDITSGNNGTYVAKAGWDACTGLGTPIVSKIVAALTTPAPTPPAPTPPAPTPPAPTPPAPTPPAPTPTPTTHTIVVTGPVTVDGKVVAS